MGIDGIGRGGPPPGAPEARGIGAVDKKGSVGETFSVEKTGAARRGDEIAALDPAAPLARLRAGEIDLGGYVDLKVDEATRGLEGLSPAEMVDLKDMLREQIVTDPGLADLVRAATGQAPEASDE